MRSKLNVVRHVIYTVRKFYSGSSDHPLSATVGLKNALSIVRYLIARKLGWSTKCRVSLPHGHGTLIWEIKDRSDISILEEIFIDGDYDVNIPEPSVVVDLGANIGLSAIAFSLRWPNARILAVEPAPSTFARLVLETAQYANITCVNCAIGASTEPVQFFISSSHQSSSLRQISSTLITQVVNQVTLLALLDNQGLEQVDLLKFDIEGAEDDAFHDQDVFNRVSAVVGEVHPHLMREPLRQFLAKFQDYRISTTELPGGCLLLRGAKTS